jgi:hypothetical protein
MPSAQDRFAEKLLPALKATGESGDVEDAPGLFAITHGGGRRNLRNAVSRYTKAGYLQRSLLLGFILPLLQCASSSPKPRIPLPPWALEDCVERDGTFVFSGTGYASSEAEAAQRAVLAAKKAAILCLFGGTIHAEIEIKSDSRTGSSVRDDTLIRLTSEQVSWQGFELVPGRIVITLDTHQAVVYAQYRWDKTLALSAKARMDAINADLERTRALKEQIAVQQRIMTEQSQKLAELERQERELAALRDQAEAAAARIVKMGQAQGARNDSIRVVLSKVYCGMTLAQLAAFLGPPEESAVTVAPNSGVGCDNTGYSRETQYVWRHARWGEWTVEVQAPPGRSYCLRSPADAWEWAKTRNIVRMDSHMGQKPYRWPCSESAD